MLGPPPFNLTPDNTPRTAWPINRLQPIIDFYDLCSNAAAEFVPGYGPDSVNDSDAGMFCKRRMIEVLPYAGKVASEFQVPRPIIRVRPKFFLRSLAMAKGDVDRATRICELLSTDAQADPVICSAAADIYRNVYRREVPSPDLPYREDFEMPPSAETLTTGYPVRPQKVKVSQDTPSTGSVYVLVATFVVVGLAAAALRSRASSLNSASHIARSDS